ncbi:MAG: anion transporter [Deltaproteobacteria bacterium]|nr:anion transporter [Deltaproteobacteria bacterium]
MTSTTLVIFVLVYAGMILGGLPYLQLDRTGVALLGAIALVATGAVPEKAAAGAVDLATILLLFSFMVVSAQMRLGGFYGHVTRWLAGLALAPPALLGALVAVVAVLSAVFSNDVVCLAMAPLLADACARRGLDPRPFLLGLACAANVGSAATLIGNPQNILIGQALSLPFSGYLAAATPPVLVGLLLTWAILAGLHRGRWEAPPAPGPAAAPPADEPPLDLWQTGKGLAVTAVLLVLFLAAPWPRELTALGAAGLLLTSRRMHSRQVLGLVDWELLVLFVGLFVVNHALQATGLPARAVEALAARGVDLSRPAPLFGATFLLSNVVSNVPAVMLLLPVATHPVAGTLLALVSTLAGNLLVVGSIANIIVVDAAARRGIRIDWRTHARVGLPVTAATLAVAALFLAWRAGGS